MRSDTQRAPAVLPPAGDPHTLYLIDISGYVFRAFHALPPLTTASGQPTNALYGVANMVLKLLDEHRPVHIAAAMECKGPSFRAKRYTAYKANRPPAPEELKAQMGRVRELLESLSVRVFEHAEAEADDVIASLVRGARERALQVVIVSADKDLLQLVQPGVWMFDSMRDRVFDPNGVEQKLGVPPAQVRDLLALVGDSSDNVPGVPSVGPKTATTLLAQHRNLDAIYEHLGDITRKGLRQKLEQHRDQAYLSRELVTLKHDLALALQFEDLKHPGLDLARIRPLFEELEFGRLLERLDSTASTDANGLSPAVAALPEANLVTTPEGLDKLRDELRGAGRFALVCLGDDVRPHVRLSGLGLAWSADSSAYVPLGHAYLGCPSQLSPKQVFERLGPLLENATLAKSCADYKLDRSALLAHGVRLSGVVFDSTLASYLLDPDRRLHNLPALAETELGLTLPTAVSVLGSGKSRRQADELPLQEACGYAAAHAHGLWRLAGPMTERLEQAGVAELLRELELPLAEVLAEMEATGIRVDTQQLARLATQIAGRLLELETKCRELAGRDFNVNSPRQLEVILFDELELPVIKRTKTARSTDHEVLEELAAMHELPAAILEHRTLAKLKSTYLDALPREIHAVTGRIHSRFHQAVAATGRLSSSDPNLQNIPIKDDVGRLVRDAFVPRDGWSLLSADYSQIELRVLAHLSEDPELVQAYQQNQDVHVRTATAIFGVDAEDVSRRMRAQAKTVNFAVLYGQTQFALARNLRISRAEAKRYIDAFFARYQGVKRYLDQVVERARETGQSRTLCGRVRHIPDLKSRHRARRQAAERVARNSPIQGTAADIMKRAMIGIQRALRTQELHARMLLTVHDELVLEAPHEERQPLESIVRNTMEHALPLRVPLAVEVGWGQSWGQAH